MDNFCDTKGRLHHGGRLREGMDSDLERLCASLVHEEEIRRNILKIKNELVKYKVSSMSIFRRVPADYYHKSLQERGILLNCKPEQLCKSILFENTVCGHENCDDTHDSRYYVVIVQYVRKIDTDLLSSALAHLVKDKKSKIKYNFRLVSEETSHQLTSYQHNAVTVYGMLSTISLTHSITHSLTHSLTHLGMNRRIPVVICSNIMQLSPSFVYLGGGSIDVKLGIPTSLLASSTNAIIALVSKLREEDNNYE